MATREKCCKQVYGSGRFSSFHGHPCRKTAKVERDGKWYCGTHDPVEVAKKDKARKTKWDAEWEHKSANRDATRARNEALHKLCGHIPTEELGSYGLVRLPAPSTKEREA